MMVMRGKMWLKIDVWARPCHKCFQWRCSKVARKCCWAKLRKYHRLVPRLEYFQCKWWPSEHVEGWHYETQGKRWWIDGVRLYRGKKRIPGPCLTVCSKVCLNTILHWKSARVIFEYGKCYWNNDDLLEQIKVAVSIAEAKYPLDIYRHTAFASDALVVSRLNKKPGGK